MAKKTYTVTELTDDLDGSKADRTISFTLQGTSYEIDLSKKNAAAFEKAFAVYVQAARRAPATRRGRSGTSAAKSSRRGDLAEIRSWAKANGHNVGDKGRIPAHVTEAYDAAH